MTILTDCSSRFSPSLRADSFSCGHCRSCASFTTQSEKPYLSSHGFSIDFLMEAGGHSPGLCNLATGLSQEFSAQEWSFPSGMCLTGLNPSFLPRVP